MPRLIILLASAHILAEYVLVGTLLSFTLAIALAVTTQWAMKQ